MTPATKTRKPSGPSPQEAAQIAAQVTLRYPFNALVSYHYYKKVDLAALTAGGLRLIGDSGAFSAKSLGAEITIPEFAEWAALWRDHLCWVASLDVINDPDATWRNYRRLRDKHGLDVVPTIHVGDPAKWMDRYAKDGVDFIGLGGLVPHRGRPKATMPWLVEMMRYARERHPQMRFHGWGVTNPALTKALPWYSMDSSNLGQSYRYGRLVVFNPDAGTWVQISLDGRSSLAHDDLLRRHYNVRARQVLVSTPATRQLLVRLTGRSYQLVEDYLRRRHGAITAPRYGVQEPRGGPHVHAALGGQGAQVYDVGGLVGPHVHAVTGNGGGGGMKDDMALATGPHLHATDGAVHNLRNLTKPGRHR